VIYVNIINVCVCVCIYIYIAAWACGMSIKSMPHTADQHGKLGVQCQAGVRPVESTRLLRPIGLGRGTSRCCGRAGAESSARGSREYML